VLETLLEGLYVGERNGLAIDESTRVSGCAQFAEEIGKLALFLTHDRGNDLKARPVFECHQLVRDLLHGLRLDDLATLWAMCDSDASPQQAHVIVDLGYRSHGGTWIPVRRFLINRDGRA
jgi:hypothetical protein